MSRTQAILESLAAHSGGVLFWNAASLAGQFANLAFTRNAGGDYSLNRTAAGAETYNPVASVSLNLLRLLETPPGVPPGSAFIVPPATSAQMANPTTEPRGKGLQIVDLFAVYQVGVVALTAAGFALNITRFQNGIANTVTGVPLSAPAVTLAAAATPYVYTAPVTTPTFINTDTTDVFAEFAFTMATTGTIRLYGLGMHVNFNYN